MKSVYGRRKIIKGLLAFSALALAPVRLLARNKPAFQATASDAVINALFGDRTPVETDQINFKVPDIAENGAVVPVSISTTLENVKSISLIVDENPNPLSATFNFMPGAVPDISTRIKVGNSSDIRALVETDSALFMVQKNVKVTIGGCGG